MSSFSFPRTFSLKSKKSIQAIFAQKKSISVYPIRFFYVMKEMEQSKFAFSVPKKNFKKATDRNLIKRRMREAFRLLRPEFQNAWAESPKQLEVFFIYTGKEIPDFTLCQMTMQALIHKMSKENFE